MTDISQRLGAALGDRYRIEREIGRGGMAVVYLAEDLRHHRRVAIKVLRPELASALGPERFLREIEIAARLTHPHILALHDSGAADGLLFYVMPYLEGDTFRDRLDREHRLPFEDAIRFTREVADGLGYAHSLGLVHRDIKPENILFQAGHALVADFGIARAVSAAGGGRLTETGAAIGTLLYMSPEQALGAADLDSRSDVYSLGCVCWEMLTGEVPFGTTVADPGVVPPMVEAVIARARARAPEDRYRDGSEFGEALARLPAGAGTAAPSLQSPRGRMAGWLGAGALILAAAAFWGFRHAGADPIRSLAVLPVQNLSGDSTQEYFAEGMQDALIGELAGIGSLRVISRTSTLRYRKTGKSVPEIARELQVDAVVESSALRSGDSVRMRVHLIRARPVERDLWADHYDRELRHVVAMQREIALALARQVGAPLSPEEERRLAGGRPVDPGAYDAYLRGMSVLHAAATTADFQRGLAHLNHAIARDSADPLPWAGLALGYDQVGHLSSEIPDAFARAKAAGARAEALGGDLGETEAALAQTALYYDWDFTAAERAFRRAIALNSSLADAHSHYGWLLLLLGRTDEGIASLRRAEAVDPLTPLWPAFTASGAAWVRRLDEADSAIARFLARNSKLPIGHLVHGDRLAQAGRYQEAVAAMRRAAEGSADWRWGLGYALALAGQPDAARRIAEELRQHPTGLDAWGLASVYAALGDRAEAIRWLEAAYRARWNWMPWMDFNPVFEPLRGDPRFEELRRRVGAPRCGVCSDPG